MTDDMATPVTRGELRAELAAFAEKLELTLEQKFDVKLGLWGGALLERIASSEARMMSAMADMERRLTLELRSHTLASAEELASRVTVVDDTYRDLPRRVTRLEAKLFPPKRRRVR